MKITYIFYHNSVDCTLF